MVTEEIYQLNSMLIEGVLPEKQEGVESSATQSQQIKSSSSSVP
jgi:hypothetical protein